MRRLRPLAAGTAGAVVTILLVSLREMQWPLAVVVGLAAAILAWFVFRTGDRLHDLYRK